MSGERLAPWRKTGRKADPRHFEGLEIGCLLEMAVYDDRNRPQGRALAAVTGAALETYISGGRVFECQMLAIEDGYYLYWFENEYGKLTDSPAVFVHFCDVPVGGCRSETAFRNPIHVDVFRLVTSAQAERLVWLTADQKAFVAAHPAVVGGKDVPWGRSCFHSWGKPTSQRLGRSGGDGAAWHRGACPGIGLRPGG